MTNLQKLAIFRAAICAVPDLPWGSMLLIASDVARAMDCDMFWDVYGFDLYNNRKPMSRKIGRVALSEVAK